MINLVSSQDHQKALWQLEKNEFIASNALVEESLFTVGNGYVGIRGCFEEGYGQTIPLSVRGAYINGLYDRMPIVYGESAYGFPTLQDKQPKIIDTQTCEIYLDEERVLFDPVKTQHYKRVLDFRKGESVRSYDYLTRSGKKAHLVFKRLASLNHKNTFIYRIEVTYDGGIALKSRVDTHVVNEGNPSDPRVSSVSEKLWQTKELSSDKQRIFALLETQNTGLYQATIVDYKVLLPSGRRLDKAEPISHRIIDESIETCFQGKETFILEKHCYFTDSLREQNPIEKVNRLADDSLYLTYEDYSKEQVKSLETYWNQSDILIDGEEGIQETLRFMRYQILQSTGTDAYANISAKGLSGEGYGGHYFWDTEIYVLPLVQMTQPKMAEPLLAYRHRILPFARARAIELGFDKGAVYPWRTISGIECSAYFPAGTAQFHINADIAYAFISAYLYNQDINFLIDMGAEVILETARIWLQMGHYDKGLFKINTVTGPDEYTAIVNNNYYTNAMAKYHLEWAFKVYDILYQNEEINQKKRIKSLLKKLDFGYEEAVAMLKASREMYLPHDETLGIDIQDDTFLSKPKWPFEKVEASKYPLLLYFHPLTIYRHQVLKQADTVLAHFLLEDYSDEATMRKSFDYYEAITTHDSSLSTCIYGIMASRGGDHAKAYQYFKASLYLDLEDTHHNTKDGLHMANIAGTCLSIINGFAGYRIKESGISFRPSLPNQWKSYRFKIHYQDRWIDVWIADRITFTLLEGKAIDLKVWDETYKLTNQLIIDWTQERSQHEQDNQRYYF